MSGGIRQSDGLLRVARRRRFHVRLGAMESGQDHPAFDYSFCRGTSPPRPLSSPQGNDSGNANRRRDDRPRDQVKTRSPSRVPSATSRRHVELSSTRTSSWAGMRVLPAVSPSRWRAPLARSAPADSSSRRHCRGTGTRCLGPRCPHCAPRLPGPQDPDRGDGPCSLVSFASSRGHGPFGCPGRQCPLRWPACLGVGSL